ncbi:peroxisomal membrane protein pex14 [Coemansia javaensis]|uniref:Peroxisomal membrane protein PEX14 n=1 Tax=Coemansia javaensis TaxID=2761396 RepID=A0A9W8H7L1_9FUNG|nr:peroxisomal membrane protein pex14 [Coemansia javaensis]
MSAEAPAAAAAAAAAVAQPAALRGDIIDSAVRFLADPKVQSSTLAKKISFLESKGLTNAEIEDALARARSAAQLQPQDPAAAAAGSSSSSDAAVATSYGYAQPMRPPPPPPPRPPLDWKDYFIAAVVAGGLGYGLFMLAKKYVAPLLLVREENERLEAEKRLLVEQGEQTRRQLEALAESTTRILEALSQQAQKTGDAVEGVAAIVDGMATHGTEQRAQTTRLLIILEDLQKSVADLSSARAGGGDGGAKIADVQSDIRSLRSLILSRRAPAHAAAAAAAAAPVGSAANSPALTSEPPAAASPEDDAQSAVSVPTPTIPAWQLNDK